MTTDLTWANVEVPISNGSGDICWKIWEINIIVFVHQEECVAMVT